jgi:hypothetical protein
MSFQQISRRRVGDVTVRKPLLLVAAICLSVGLLEFGARVEYRLTQGESFPTDAVRERLAPSPDADLILRTGKDPRANEGPGDPEPDRIANKALHPFTGYVHDHSGARKSTNRFGFPGLDPLWPPTDGEVRIAITGGSVALQLFKEAGRHLRGEFARQPALAGRKIRLIALTLGGYKQPQQLMSLAWFLSLGAHFDAVINLDGFNEVVLPYTDNVPDGVYPAFPRSWKLYAQKSLDGNEIDALIEIRRIRAARNALRARLGTGLPASSTVVLRVLERMDQRYAVELADAERSFRGALGEGHQTYQVSGPAESFATDRELFDELVRLWSASSLQMHRLARANGIAYFHFLQPNQYVTGSKPFTAEEERIAIRHGAFPPKAAVRATYGALAREGQALREAGVAFTDLTRAFADDPETVYRDSCCHFNERGIHALADRIALVVGGGLAPRAPPTGP